MTVKTSKEKFHFWIYWTLLSLAIIIAGYIAGGIALLLIHGSFGFNMKEWGTPLSQTVGNVAEGAILGLAVGLFQRSFLRKLFNVPAFWV